MSAQVIIHREPLAPPGSPAGRQGTGRFRFFTYAVIAIVGFIAGFCIGQMRPQRKPADVPSQATAPVPHPRSLNTGNWDQR